MIQTPILPITFLLVSVILSGTATALQRLGQFQAKEILKKNARLFFFQKFLPLFFGEKKWDGLLFSLYFGKKLLLICYALATFSFLITQPSILGYFHQNGQPTNTFSVELLLIAAIITIGVELCAELCIDFLSSWNPGFFFRIFAPITSCLLLICAPIAAIVRKTSKILTPSSKSEKNFSPSYRIREKILEIFHESELSAYLDPNDQKLILSVVSFKERIAREVMVPRIDVFSLASDTTIQEAAESFLSEGYSRIPVYKESVDHIIGVLLYKDVLKIYTGTESEKAKKLDMAIESILKPVLYTPETKKISQLLQEFRNKQIHLAIVVDEYGGTEGIVTIEDILEELVGEIADEYDIEEEVLFSILPSGGWIVDARMNIIDIEEELGIKIPQGPEYDTIGGYIFHRAGSIPTKGWRIHQDDFDLEILSSDDRSIDKIRITPRIPS